LGSRVVASNLQPGMITLHMLMALAIVGVLLFALARARRGVAAASPVTALDPGFTRWLYILLGLTVLQVALGTQVREIVDFLRNTAGAERTELVAALPWFFYVHRSLSALVLGAGLWVMWLAYCSLGSTHTLTRFSIAMVAVLVLTVVSGAALGHLGMPMLVQPAHLLTASLLFGLQFLMWMEFRHASAASEAAEGSDQDGLLNSSA